MSGMVNSELFLAPLRRQDAVTSSRMEGTISTIEELYRLEAEEDAGSADPYREARNDDVETYLYSRALRNAQQALADGAPLGEHLIRTAHQQLLSFGRGARKRPGSYKVEQNYIGDERRERIYYVPIAPEQLGPAMGELVRYINESTMRPLICTAIAHVEFEALHPFEDGNGRIGRAIAEKALSQAIGQPSLIALSQTIQRRRSAYYDALEAANKSNEISDWLAYWAETVLEAQTHSLALIDFLLEKTRFHDRYRGKLNARQEKVVARMFREGLDGFKGGLSAANYITFSDTSRATATRDLQELVALGAMGQTGTLKATRYHLILDADAGTNPSVKQA